MNIEDFKKSKFLKKVPMSITIDSDLKEYLDKADINISRYLNQLLREVLK